MPKPKTRVVSVRINESLYRLLRQVANELNKMSGNPTAFGVGDVIRLMVQYCGIMYCLGEWKKPLSQARKEFLEFLKG